MITIPVILESDRQRQQLSFNKQDADTAHLEKRIESHRQTAAHLMAAAAHFLKTANHLKDGNHNKSDEHFALAQDYLQLATESKIK